MILSYTSKAAQGKSSIMLIDAVKESVKGKKVAFISFELSQKKILSRINQIVDFYKLEPPKEKRSLVVYQGYNDNSYNLFEKLEELYKEFDLICIDSYYPIIKKDFDEIFLNKLFYFTLGREFWFTQNTVLNVGEINNIVKKTKNLENYIMPKKHSLINDKYLTVVDFVEKTIEEIDLAKIFK